VFQTGIGTKALFSATDALHLSEKLLSFLKAATIAVRGPKPTGALRQRGVHIDRSAVEPFTTKEVLESIKDIEVNGGRVIVQRYGAANRELDAALEARGAEVTEIPTYRWSLPADTAPLVDLVARLQRGEMHAVLFTNAEQVRNLFLVAEKKDDLQDALNRTLVASIGPVASRALREAGVKIGLEASPPKLGALLSALEGAL
jgi:uroporphyrinogen-III synthase